MRKYIYTIFILLYSFFGFAQQDSTQVKRKSNPILYGDFLIGGSGGKATGITFGFDLNYQINKDLITFRSIYILDKNKEVGFEAILIFPIFHGGDSMNEFALLYGKRYVFDGSALSISVGVSTNLIKKKIVQNDENITFRDSYVGIPFEVNFNIFKKEKRRFRIVYGLIPVGKPTAFGRSIGIKFFGNIGEFNYFGLGINTGLGWHKKY